MMKYNWMLVVLGILACVSTVFAGGPLTWELSKYGGRSPYEVLIISETATFDEIKQAYRKLAMKYHPDRHGDKSELERKNVEEKFKNIKDAYEFLSDDDKRANWDQIASWSKSVYSKRNGNSSSNSNSNPFQDSWARWSHASSTSDFSRDSASNTKEQTSSMTSMPWYNKGKSYNENFIIAFSSSADDKDLSQWIKASSFDYKPDLFRANLANYFQSVLDQLMQVKLNAPVDSQMKPKIEKYLQALRRILARPMAKPYLPDLHHKLFKTLPHDLAIHIVPSHSQSTGSTKNTRSWYANQEQITSLRSMPWYRSYLSYEENFILSLGTNASDWEISQWMMTTRFASDAQLLSLAMSEIQRLGHGLRHYEAESVMFVGHPARYAAEEKMEEYIQSLRRVLNRPQLARFYHELDHALRHSVNHQLYMRVVDPLGSSGGGSGGFCHRAQR